MLGDQILDIVVVIYEFLSWVLCQLLLKYFVLEIFFHPLNQYRSKLWSKLLFSFSEVLYKHYEFFADLTMFFQLFFSHFDKVVDSEVEIFLLRIRWTDCFARCQDFVDDIRQLAINEVSDAAFDFSDAFSGVIRLAVLAFEFL